MQIEKSNRPQVPDIFSKLIIAFCLIGIILLLLGYFTDIPLWGVLTSKTISAPVFYPLLAIGIILTLMFAFKKETARSLDKQGKYNPVAVGIIAGIVGAIAIWLLGSGNFFWRNIFSGPISLFGNFSEIVKAHSDLPPDFELTELWQQSLSARLAAMFLGGIYILLLSLISSRLSTDGKTKLLAFLFMATSGLIAVFTSADDFAVLLLLSALNVFLTIQFFNGKLPIYVPGLVILISVLFHPVFVLFALAILYVKLSAKLLDSGKSGIPILLLAVLILLGIGLSLFEKMPFTSVLRPETSASEVFGAWHIWGFLNQMIIVSHFIWVVALITVIYMFITSRVTELHGILFGAWFISSSAFYLFSYSIYGWIFGYPGAAIVVFPAILWLAYFIGKMEKSHVTKTFTVAIVINILTTISLLATVHSSTTSADIFAPHLKKENAFNPKFKDGSGALLIGTMYSENLRRYDDAVGYLKAFYERHPLNIAGKYEYGWALSNTNRGLVRGVGVLDKVEDYLVEKNKLFWEFNYRIGTKRLLGHNTTYGSIALERAAAERNTAEIARKLGSVYEKMKVYDSMKSKFDQAIQLGDSSKENFFKVADACTKLGDSVKALNYFRYGVEHFPDYIDNYQYLAGYYFLHKKYDSLEALAEYGLKHAGRHPGLEASMILVYNYTGRQKQCDSLYDEFLDYFRTYPSALYDWGVFLEENGLVYKGRVMQAKDVSIERDNLRAALTFYHYFKNHNQPDSARSLIDRFLESDTTTEVIDVLKAVRHYDTILWPKTADTASR